MILVESRFRVANGTHDSVRDAFLQRPGFVDDVSGFLGMDVYQAADDGTVFHLVTRWTDRDSYHAWHGSAGHRDSHAYIPRGLKLDASYTRLTVMDRIESPSMASALSDSSAAVAEWLTTASTTYVITLSEDAHTGVLNAALRERLRLPESSEPTDLSRLLANDEAHELAARVTALRTSARRGTAHTFLLNFACGTRSPFTLRCRMDVQPRYAVLLAEEADRAEDQLRDELMRTNNELATLARERERQRQELEKARDELTAVNAEVATALEALETSHWHIRRIEELLPTCLDCGKVKTEDGTWRGVQQFLMANATRPFLSHGYCPVCIATHLANLDAEIAT